jgi:hypothetical protein
MAASNLLASAGPGSPPSGGILFTGFMIKSPPNADERDPDKSTGFHSWRKRFFRLVAGGPQVRRSRPFLAYFES